MSNIATPEQKEIIDELIRTGESAIEMLIRYREALKFYGYTEWK